MITVSTAVKSLCPEAQFVCDATAVVEWHSTNITQPTSAEIAAEVARLTAEQPRQQAEQYRASAYRSEADPLFFKSMRGEATTDEWTAKVAEIKARFPYPGADE